MLNTVILQGRLTKDAELRYTNTKKAVCTFTLACDRGGNNGVDFVTCTAWENLGQFVNQYFHKGDMILVQGRLEQRNFEDREGIKRTVYEIRVGNVNFCGSKKADDREPKEVSYSAIADADGELPF